MIRKDIYHLKKSRLIVSLLCWLLIFTVSCEKKEEPFLRIGKGSLEFKEEGGTQKVSVTTNQSVWKTVTAIPWGTVTDREDEIEITVAPNTEIKNRNASVLVIAGTLIDTLNIRQEAAKPTLILDASEWVVPAEGGTTTIRATTNANKLEAISSAGWLSVRIVDKVILLTASDNPTPDSRACTVEIKSSYATCQIDIQQKGSSSTLSLSAEKWSVPAKGGQTSINVTTNHKNLQITSGADWLTASLTGQTIMLTAQSNLSINSRSAFVTVKAGSIEKKIEVEQEAQSPQLSLSATTWKVGAQGGSTTVIVTTTATNIQAISADGWLTASLSGKNITLTAQANTATQSRTTFVSVKANGIEKRIEITQEGVTNQLSLSTYSWTVSAQGGSTTVIASTDAADLQAVSTDGWLTTSVSGKNITLTAQANTAAQSRTTFVSVKANGIEKRIEITQEGASADLSLSLDNWKPDEKGGTIKINVTTENAQIQVFSSADWLTASITGKTITLLAKPNTSTTSRTAYVTVKTPVTETRIEITQEGAPAILSLSSENWNVASQGGSTNIIATTNAQNLQAVSYSPEWLTARVSNRTILLEAIENKNQSSRSGVVKVTAGTAAASIFVTQAAAAVTIQAPTVTTTAIRYGSDEVYTGGTIVSDGGSPVTSYGVCWNTAPNPTIVNNKTLDGSGNGSYQSIIQERRVGITVYVRAYASNAAGTSYGEQVTFDSNLFTDIDGNLYSAVQIGNQVWMNRNLCVKRYNNGAKILDTKWGNGTDGKYIIGSHPQYEKRYGLLYNWYACIDIRNICPKGWHVPTSTEWRTLCSNLGGTNVAGKKLKSTDHNTFNWWSGEATNEVGFNAYPGGYCQPNGTTEAVTYQGHWWTQSKGQINFGSYGVAAIIRYNSNGVIVDNYDKAAGRNVRCIRD